MKITRFVLHGAPQSGKSSARDLLVDKPPVDKESTRLAEDPVQAVCTNPSTTKYMRTDQSLLEELNEEKIMRMVQSEVKNEATKEASKNLSTAAEKPESPPVNPSPLTNVKSSHSQSTQSSPQVTPSAAELPPSEVLRDIATNLDSLDPSITPFFECHHLNIVDSGGQPEFSNLLPLVCESESHHHAVVIRLDKKLKERSPNCININGKVYNLPQHLMLTDYQLIERVLQLAAGSKSHVIIIGTHLDKVSNNESLQIKYDLLQPLVEKYESNLILNGGKPIFAVNAMAPVGEERTGYARTLQEVMLSAPVLSHGGQVADEEGGIEVPLPWIVLELELHRRSKSGGIIAINEVSEVAKVLKVQDSSEALAFFNKLGVLYHYPKVLSDIVFTSISPISSRLSDIVEASFDLKHTPKTDDHKMLQKTGKLSKKFLKCLMCSKAKSNDLFTVDEFISLLKYFRILFQINQDTFLIPSLLPIDPEHFQHIDYSQYREPLVCFWKHNDDVRILPQSYYHALIVELLSNNDGACKVLFTQMYQSRLIFNLDATFKVDLDDEEKRRLVLIDRTFWLEMLVDCDTLPEQCQQLLRILQSCTTRVLAKINLTQHLEKLKFGLHCIGCCDPPHPSECIVRAQCKFECLATKQTWKEESNERLFWFEGLCIKLEAFFNDK